MPAERLAALLAELGLSGIDPGAASLTGADPVLLCRYPLGESAAAVAAATGLVVAALGERRGLPPQQVEVDVRHAAASLRGFLDQELDGERLDPDPTGKLPLVGLFRTRDGGWVQTYGVFPPLKERTAAVLGVPEDATREVVAAAVAARDAAELVAALVAAGVPGAAVATRAEWKASAQGRALAARPAVTVERIGDASIRRFTRPGLFNRPLDGLRVLDVTRILAGPVAGRTLAEHGADVLQLTAPGLPTVRRAMLDTSAGKRSAHLDFREERAAFEELVRGADVVCANARPGAFARHGLGPQDLAELRPGIVCVEADCFGHGGPWSQRPGFEPIAQAATGWADAHRNAAGEPTIVPALPSDYLAGAFGALGALVALLRQADEGGSWRVRVSLCRTADWLAEQPGHHDPKASRGVDFDAFRIVQDTGWGRVRQLAPLARLSVTPPEWTVPAALPGSHPAAWR